MSHQKIPVFFLVVIRPFEQHTPQNTFLQIIRLTNLVLFRHLIFQFLFLHLVFNLGLYTPVPVKNLFGFVSFQYVQYISTIVGKTFEGFAVLLVEVLEAFVDLSDSGFGRVSVFDILVLLFAEGFDLLKSFHVAVVLLQFVVLDLFGGNFVKLSLW